MVARHSDGKDENTGFWTIGFGNSPVIGTAIHDGHRIRPDIAGLMALSGEQRLREEDPFTGDMIAGLTNRIIVHHSRFEIDLNRAADQAIYLKPEQSWGLEVWKEEPAQEAIRQSLDFHADYYAMLETVLSAIERRHGAFVVLDVHSYNHRRQGAAAPPTAQAEAPDINIGTFSMDRSRWGDIVSAVGHHFASATIGGKIDLFEPIHGSAPDIAGQNKANPLGTIASAAMLLRYTGKHEQAAVAIENAIRQVLEEGYRTADIARGGEFVSTSEMGDLVIKTLSKNSGLLSSSQSV